MFYSVVELQSMGDISQMIPIDEHNNYDTFRDCLSTVVIERLAPANAKPKKRVKGRKNEIKPVVQIAKREDGETDANELSDFTEVRKALRCSNMYEAEHPPIVSGRGNLHKFATRTPNAFLLDHSGELIASCKIRGAA